MHISFGSRKVPVVVALVVVERLPRYMQNARRSRFLQDCSFNHNLRVSDCIVDNKSRHLGLEIVA